MSSEKALGLVIKTSDWSESSRIATFFTREFGKVRVLAKGGRRLKSNFEVALDLLGVCSIVLLRKASGGLELLTEARIEERFPALRTELSAMYAGYYIAELLEIGTQESDPHPTLFERALETLRSLNKHPDENATRMIQFELEWLREIGYTPQLQECVTCSERTMIEDDRQRLAFSAIAGGVICEKCQKDQRDKRALTHAAWKWLCELNQTQKVKNLPDAQRIELRQLMGYFVSHVLGRRPKLLNYLD
jgi:DNA repair protein RecO (recombination protein O)